jgi:hypothetical protein
MWLLTPASGVLIMIPYMTLYKAARCGKTKYSIVNSAACVQFICMIYSLNGNVRAVNHPNLQVIAPFYGLWWSVKHISAQPDGSGPHSTFIEGAFNSTGTRYKSWTHADCADTLRELRGESDTLFKHPRTVNQHRPRSTRRHKVNVNRLSTSWRHIGGAEV